MGSPKPLLRWHGVSLVEYQTRCLLEGGVSEVVVVLGHRAEDVIPFVEGPNVRYVVNSRYREGKTTSIKTGLAAVSLDADAIALLAVDQPRTADVYAATDGRILSLSEGTLRRSIDSDSEVAAHVMLNIAKILCMRILTRG